MWIVAVILLAMVAMVAFVMRRDRGRTRSAGDHDPGEARRKAQSDADQW